jgi:hypothetical protein
VGVPSGAFEADLKHAGRLRMRVAITAIIRKRLISIIFSLLCHLLKINAFV